MHYFKDYVHEFEEVSICTMGPDFDHDGQVDDAQCTITLHGSWIANINAGSWLTPKWNDKLTMTFTRQGTFGSIINAIYLF